MELSKKDIDFLVSILKKYIDTSLATITNRGRIKVHHFEEQYMRTINGGLPLDQSLFRTYLQTCGKVNVWIDSNKTGVLPTDGDQDVLYFLWVDGSYVMYIYTDTYVLITTTTQIDDLNVSGATTYSSQKIVSLIVTTCLGISYNNLISGLQSTNAQGAIDELKFLIDAIKQTGSGRLGAPLYLTDEDSDIEGYKKLSYEPDANPKTLNIPVTNGEVLVGTFLFDDPVDVSFIGSGNWIISMFAKVSSSVGDSRLRTEFFFRKVSAAEGEEIEEDLVSVSTREIDNTTYAIVPGESASTTLITPPTSRVGIRLYASTTAASEKIVSVQLGNGFPTYVATPLSIRHDQTRDKNSNPDFLHATQSQHERWTNNYTYKIEDTSVSTWSASSAYAGYGYQAQINIPNLTESDIVSVVFAGVDVISGNYYPTIEQYDGYILVFAKVNTTIIIPTIEINKIDL